MQHEPPRHYQGIAYLARTGEARSPSPTRQIEALIGEPLPLAALYARLVDDERRSACAAVAGARLARLPRSARRQVRFVRDAEEEAADA